MPKTKQDDGKRWLFLQDIQGHLAMWAVRQSPYHNPEGLSIVLSDFQTHVRDRFDQNRMAKMDRGEVAELLKQLHRIPEFLAWNNRKNGRQGPGFCSRYDRPSPDDDFIDLCALTNNTVRSLFKELDYELRCWEPYKPSWLELLCFWRRTAHPQDSPALEQKCS